MEDHVGALYRYTSKRTARGAGDRCAARAFGLMDLLVSILIVSILIAVLMPALAKVRESARRVVCGSNLRQVGLGIQMYSDDWDTELPWSVYLGPSPDGSDDHSAQMNRTRVSLSKARTPNGFFRQENRAVWDGLGLLFDQEYLGYEVFYCPSHHGEHPLNRYTGLWGDDTTETIVSNFQYRGRGPGGTRMLDQIRTSAALVSDALSSVDDYNHIVGTNVLRVGGSVRWIPDEPGNALASLLNDEAPPEGGSVSSLWNTLDSGGLD